MVDAAAPERAITRGGYTFVVLWTLGLLLLYVTAGCIGVPALLREKAATEELRRDWFARAATGGGTARTDPAPPEKVSEVSVGMYINRIAELSIKDGTWSADCDIWFRWSDARIKPGESFRVVNGEVTQRDRVEARSEDGVQYERLRLKVGLTHFFNPDRFPLSDELLSIQIDDPTFGRDRARYVADEPGSGVSRSGVAPQLVIRSSNAFVQRQGDAPAGTDPRIGSDGGRASSAFVLSVLIKPPGWALYLRLFQALFASTAISFIVFFIKPIHVDPRFGLGVGGAFSSIANNLVLATYFPMANHLSLMVLTNALGLLTIFLTLVESTVSLYVYDTLGQPRLRVVLDRASFVVFAGGYVTLNVLLPCTAAS